MFPAGLHPPRMWRLNPGVLPDPGWPRWAPKDSSGDRGEDAAGPKGGECPWVGWGMLRVGCGEQEGSSQEEQLVQGLRKPRALL